MLDADEDILVLCNYQVLSVSTKFKFQWIEYVYLFSNSTFYNLWNWNGTQIIIIQNINYKNLFKNFII